MDHEKGTDYQGGASAEPFGEKTVVARSFTIEGDLVAKEDTLIQGRIKGSIVAEDHTVRIGEQGDVSGEVLAKNVIAEGRIEGKLTAKETVVLRKGARVQGEILAPRVAMEEGCRFNGNVEMSS